MSVFESFMYTSPDFLAFTSDTTLGSIPEDLPPKP